MTTDRVLQTAPNSRASTSWLLRASSLLITVLVPIIIVLISVRLMMTEVYLNLEYNKPDFPADTYGFTLQDRLRLGPYAIQYMLNSAGIDYLGNLTKPDGTQLYNTRELDHMVDVKRVTQAAFGVLAALVFVTGVLALLLVRSEAGRRALRQGLFSGGLLMLVILAGLVIYVLLKWDDFFVQFHELFFSNGSWVFEYSDSLIRLFPVRFWQDAALTIGGMSVAFAVLLLVLVWRWSRQAAHHS